MTATSARSRLLGIQGLRFIAALLVVLTHATFYASERLDSAVDVWHFGEVGVDIFFVISGVVMGVTGPRFVGKVNGWRSFAMRRVIRIVPVYWIATTVKVISLIVLPSAVLHAQLTPVHTILSYFFLPTTGQDGRHEPLLGVGWTLIFEMFFYAMFTIALALKIRPLWFIGGIMTILSIGAAFRGDSDPAAFMYFNPIVLYFVAGLVIADWLRERNTASALRWLGWIFALWSAYAMVHDSSAVDIGYIWRHVWVVGLVAAVATSDRAIGHKIPSLVTRLGDASYSLYLFHPLSAPLVPVVLSRLGVISPALSVCLTVVGVSIMALLIFRFIEKPTGEYLTARLPYVGRAPLAPGIESASSSSAN